MRICTVVGARPQFIKASVVSAELRRQRVAEDLVHTGQHYDDEMSRVFFDEMSIPEPVVNLEVGSGTHARQTGQIMVRLEEFLLRAAPYDVVLVYGDTNSTLAGALVASKLQIPLAHVEAGLRSFNRRMPEEINRIVADRLSSHLFCPSSTAVKNLSDEGIIEGVVQAGDVMYDALLRYHPLALKARPISKVIPFGKGEYYLATIHRAENTDAPDRLKDILDIFGTLDRPVVWPVHPRAGVLMEQFGLAPGSNVTTLQPCGYLSMLSLIDGAAAVLTDSGGLQKEAYWLSKPCVTLRTETEWVETLEGGWNEITDLDRSLIDGALSRAPSGEYKYPFGIGDSAARVASVFSENQTGTLSL